MSNLTEYEACRQECYNCVVWLEDNVDLIATKEYEEKMNLRGRLFDKLLSFKTKKN